MHPVPAEQNQFDFLSKIQLLYSIRYLLSLCILTRFSGPYDVASHILYQVNGPVEQASPGTVDCMWYMLTYNPSTATVTDDDPTHRQVFLGVRKTNHEKDKKRVRAHFNAPNACMHAWMNLLLSVVRLQQSTQQRRSRHALKARGCKVKITRHKTVPKHDVPSPPRRKNTNPSRGKTLLARAARPTPRCSFSRMEDHDDAERRRAT